MQEPISEDNRLDDVTETGRQPGPETRGNGAEELPGAAGSRPAPSIGAGPKNTWIIFGGVGVAALIIVIGAVVGGLYFLGDDGPPSASSLSALVPEDVEYIARWDVQKVLEGEILEGLDDPDPEDWLEYLTPAFGRRVEVEPHHITTYVKTEIESWDVEMITGQFEYEDMRDDLDDMNYEEGSYRGYELWTSGSTGRTVALFEESSFVIFSESESPVKDVLNNLYRDGGSLAEAEDTDLSQVLGQLGQGHAVVASSKEGACPVRRCQAVGIALTGYEFAEEEATADYQLLFSSERAAEAAAEEYDEISDYFESLLDFEIYDAEADGQFVYGTGTGGSSFLGSLH